MSISILPHDVVAPLTTEKNESLQDEKYLGVCKKSAKRKNAGKKIDKTCGIRAYMSC